MHRVLGAGRARRLAGSAALLTVGLGPLAPAWSAGTGAPPVVTAAGTVALTGGGVVALEVPKEVTLDVTPTMVPALDVTGPGDLVGVQLTGAGVAYTLLRLPQTVGERTSVAFSSADPSGAPMAGPITLRAGSYVARVLGGPDTVSELHLAGLSGSVTVATDPRSSASAFTLGTTTGGGAQSVWGAVLPGGLPTTNLRFELAWTESAALTPVAGRWGFCHYTGPPPGDPAYSAAFCYGQDTSVRGVTVSSAGLHRMQLVVRPAEPGGTSYPAAWGQTTGLVPESGFAVAWSAA